LPDDPAFVGGLDPGQRPQQGRLADAVGTDDAEAVTRRDDQIEPGEQRPVADRPAQAAGGLGEGRRRRR
jgi:hypothetical protein